MARRSSLPRTGTDFPQLFTMNTVDGTNIVQVSTRTQRSESRAVQPRWHQDRLRRRRLDRRVYTMDADGTGATHSPAMAQQMKTSRRSTRTAASSCMSSMSIMAALQGSDIHRPRAGDCDPPHDHAIDDLDPCFSLDGTMIVFSRQVGTHREVYKMSSAGARQAARRHGRRHSLDALHGFLAQEVRSLVQWAK